MKLWQIDFIGHYPIGAVAVVKAPTKEIAVNNFLVVLAAEEPFLYPDDAEAKNLKGSNTREFLLRNCVQLVESVKILNNGNY